ncbi:periplasmic heavy metal sensor [Pelagovum pacificum]|uniref:Periplasmic heavy metal sensor n=1 Tax=Pelagovum pacificum TaxID=2588711 RepID=A0A5C5GG61_9RHOB|nr:periplasmic heavy metal sensor [Pelagovum pacificum]QQA43651.1 periplasmic heavy metal sensor [Pelagovum pacificum]TNY33214.1 periplasmic heavy metal sensor [Pelagovum pacificum]
MSMPPPRRPNRFVRVIFVLSLALNLLVVGVIVGRLVGGPKFGPPRFDMALGPVGQAFEPADRRAILQGLRARDDLELPSRRDFRQFSGELLVLLRAEPFDEAALIEAMERQRRRFSGLFEAVQTETVEFIAGLNPDERAAFADRLEQSMDRRGPGKPDGARGD